MTWLERAKRALVEQKEAEFARKQAERRKKEEEKSRLAKLAKEKAERRAKAVELMRILKASGLENLLLEVQREIWHGGKICSSLYLDDPYDPSLVGGGVSLQHAYTGLYRMGGRVPAPGEGSSSFGRTEKGRRWESLSLYLVENHTQERYYLINSERTIGRHLVPVSDSDAVNKIKEILACDSERRIERHRLPKDLKGVVTDMWQLFD